MPHIGVEQVVLRRNLNRIYSNPTNIRHGSRSSNVCALGLRQEVRRVVRSWWGLECDKHWQAMYPQDILPWAVSTYGHWCFPISIFYIPGTKHIFLHMQKSLINKCIRILKGKEWEKVEVGRRWSVIQRLGPGVKQGCKSHEKSLEPHSSKCPGWKDRRKQKLCSYSKGVIDMIQKISK